MAHKVRFGLTLSNRGVLLGLTTPDELLEVAQMADASGVFQCFEHVIHRAEAAVDALGSRDLTRENTVP